MLGQVPTVTSNSQRVSSLICLHFVGTISRRTETGLKFILISPKAPDVHCLLHVVRLVPHAATVGKQTVPSLSVCSGRFWLNHDVQLLQNSVDSHCGISNFHFIVICPLYMFTFAKTLIFKIIKMRPVRNSVDHSVLIPEHCTTLR